MSGNKTPEHLTRRYRKSFVLNEKHDKVILKRKLPPITVTPSHTKLKRVDPIIISKQISTIRTIVLIGLGRSCTSLTAGIIDGLEIPMDGSKDGHFERNVFKNWEMKEIILETIRLNKTYEIWGVQLSDNQKWLKKICKVLTNPYLIIVFRDIIANSQRMISSKDVKKSPLETINFILEEQKKLLSIIKLNYPTILISCERIRYQSEYVIDDLCNFIGISGDKEKALNRISKTGGYLIQ